METVINFIIAGFITMVMIILVWSSAVDIAEKKQARREGKTDYYGNKIDGE